MNNPMRFMKARSLPIFLVFLLIACTSAKGQIDSFLLDAIVSNNLPAIRQSLKEGANVNARDENGATPLMWAAYKGGLDAVKYLVHERADHRLKGAIYLDSTRQAYYGNLTGIAAGEGKLELLQYLVDTMGISIEDREININNIPGIPGSEGWTALLWACNNGQTTCASWLFHRGADINVANSFCLFVSIGGGHYVLADSLLTWGIKLDKIPEGFFSPLHQAAFHNIPELAERLISLKADINAQENMNGHTPLMTAVLRGSFEVAYFLLAADANTSLVDNTGKTAYQMAQETGNQPMIRLFTSKEQMKLAAQWVKLNKQLGQTDPNDFQSILGIAKQTEEVARKIFGEYHPEYLAALTILGVCYVELEKPLLAEDILEKALGIANVTGEKENIAILLTRLGGYYLVSKQYSKSESLLLNAKSLVEKSDRTWYLVLVIYSNLGILYFQTGDFNKSEFFLQRAVNTSAQLTSEIAPPVIAVTYFSIGNLCLEMGLKNQAIEFYNKGREIFEKNKAILSSTDRLVYLQLLFSLGTIIEELYPDSEKLEKITADAGNYFTEVYGDDAMSNPEALLNDPDYCGILSRILGSVYFSDSIDRVYYESLLLKAEKTLSKKLGKGDINYAVALSNFAQFYYNAKEYEKAEQMLVKARGIISNLDYASGKVSEYSISHFLINWAWGKVTENNAQMFRSAVNQNLSTLAEQIAFLSSQEAMEASSANEALFALSLNAANALPFDQLAETAFDCTVFLKGLVLSSNLELRRSINATADSSIISTFNELSSLRLQLADQYYRASGQYDHMESLEARAETLEKELRRSVPAYREAVEALQVKWTDIQAKLGADEAAVEFVHFYKFYENGSWKDSIQYAALVLRPGYRAPEMVRLAWGSEIEEAIAGGLENDILKAYTFRGVGPANKNTDPGLFNLVWKPLDSLLTGVMRVYYVPSGLLHQIAFDALACDSAELLGDRYELRQLFSSRQLVIKHAYPETSKKALVFGAINYDAPETGALVQTNAKTLDRLVNRSISSDAKSGWAYLNGGEQEGKTIESLLEASSYPVSFCQGVAATEAALKDSLSRAGAAPSILHIITHGFSYPDPKTARDNFLINSDVLGGLRVSMQDHPLLRCGLVMAGGNQYWKSGKILAGKEDGILTGYEAAQLDLRGTELVVLSACVTNRGDVLGSEGVFGMARAFKQAGARYVVASIWDVPDEATQEMMALFYGQLTKGEPVPSAFRTARQSMRKKYNANPYFWAGFVLVE